MNPLVNANLNGTIKPPIIVTKHFVSRGPVPFRFKRMESKLKTDLKRGGNQIMLKLMRAKSNQGSSISKSTQPLSNQHNHKDNRSVALCVSGIKMHPW